MDQQTLENLKLLIPGLVERTAAIQNTISLSDNYCENKYLGETCGRQLEYKDGEEYCYYCEVILAEDKRIAEAAKKVELSRPANTLLKLFNENSLMNDDLKPCTINGYLPVTETQEAAKKEAIDYVRNFDGRKGIIFFGNPGAGKSHLLSGIVKGVINLHHKSSIFISLPRLLSELKGTFGKQDINSMDIMRTLYQVDLLVIDEIGGERANVDDEGTAWAKKTLNELVDARAGKSTCYSSNYNFDQLLKLYGERDFSRIVQYAEPVKVEGPNKRLERFMNN